MMLELPPHRERGSVHQGEIVLAAVATVELHRQRRYRSAATDATRPVRAPRPTVRCAPSSEWRATDRRRLVERQARERRRAARSFSRNVDAIRTATAAGATTSRVSTHATSVPALVWPLT